MLFIVLLTFKIFYLFRVIRLKPFLFSITENKINLLFINPSSDQLPKFGVNILTIFLMLY